MLNCGCRRVVCVFHDKSRAMKKVINFQYLLFFKYNGGGFMRRVIVVTVGGRGKVYAGRVGI